jgi:hypothetical protein
VVGAVGNDGVGEIGLLQGYAEFGAQAGDAPDPERHTRPDREDALALDEREVRLDHRREGSPSLRGRGRLFVHTSLRAPARAPSYPRERLPIGNVPTDSQRPMN